MTRICTDFKDNGIKILNYNKKPITLDIEECLKINDLNAASNTCLSRVEIVLFIKKLDPIVDQYDILEGKIKV